MDANAILFVIGTAAAVIIAWRWINSPSRKIKRYIEKVRTGERLNIPQRTEWDHGITIDPEGFTIVSLSDLSDSPIFVEWASVVEATAFKRDLFSTDRVCIAFRLTGDSVVEAHEEMKGWRELCDALPVQFPGAPAWNDWFMEITTPAFELKPTPLFRRNDPVPTS